MMRPKLNALFVACSLALVWSLHAADRRGDPRRMETGIAADKGAAEEKFELIGGLPSDYKEMAEITKMTTAQQEKLARIGDERTAILAKWDERNGKRIAQYQADANKARSTRDRESYERNVERMEQQRKSTALKYDARAVQLLKSKQRSAWFSHRLWGPVEEHISEFTSLSPEQEEEAREVVERMAKGFLGRRDIAEDTSCINRTVSTIRRQVLDNAQRKEYDAAVRDKDTREREEKRRQWEEDNRNNQNNRNIRRRR